MIRITYSDDHVAEYKSLALAKFMVMSVLFASQGEVLPVEAVEVWGTTTHGVTVEKNLKIKLGVVEFE